MNQDISNNKTNIIRKVVLLFVMLSFVISLDVFSKEAYSAPARELAYEYTGTVLRVGENEIVVDDHILYFSKFVKYHRTSGKGLISKEIKAGTQIGFKLNDKKEISDIWILKKKKK